jgi:hypothetical protein
MKTLINSHAGDKCKNELNNSLQTAVDRGSTTATWIEQHAGGSMGWGGGSANVGGSAGRNTTNNDRIDENNQTNAITEGCRQTLYNMNDSNTLYSQLACNIKTSTNAVTSKIKMGASISIIVGPTEEMTAAHERNIAGINATILALISKNPVSSLDVKLGEQLRQDKQAAYENFRFDVKNSRFSITNNNIQNLINTSNQVIDDDTSIKEAITKKAVGEAVSTITQKYEMGAGAVADLESYAGTKINDTSLTTAMDIISAANDTKIESDQQGNLTLRINGSLDGINVDITQGNLTELRSELIMKAATNLGRDIANDIVHEAMTKTTAQLEALGLASYQKAIADGLAAQAKALEQAGMFGGMLGGMFGKIAMIAIPIIIILVLFSMFGFKIALVAGLIFGIYLAIAYFVGLPPFSKENFRGYYVDLTSEENFQSWLSYIVVPRREAYLTALRDRLNAERDRAFGNEYTSYDYGQQLNSALSFLDSVPERLRNVKLLTKLGPSGVFSGSPKWFQTTVYRLEYQIWEDMFNVYTRLSQVRDSSEHTVKISNSSIEKVRIEKDAVQRILNTLDAQIRENDWDSNMFNVTFNQVFADVGNQPESWRSNMEEFNAIVEEDILDRTRAVESVYPMVGGMAMDTQQAYGTVGQGYPMAYTSSQSISLPKAMDTQRAYGTVGQGYPMADSQQTLSLVSYVDATDGLATQAQAQPLQKGYTNTHKKSGHHKKVSKKSMYNDIKALSNVGGEMRVSRMVQNEYSRKNRYSVKPLYNKSPEFRPK